MCLGGVFDRGKKLESDVKIGDGGERKLVHTVGLI